MKKFILLVALFSFTLSCSHTSVLKQTTVSARRPAEALEWFAATESQVAAAVCRQKLPNTTEEIFRYYRNLPAEQGLENGTTEVAGIPLVNERPRLILALAKLLTMVKNEDVKDIPANFKSTFKIGASCKTALCVSQNIFGENVGPQMLFLMDRFDVNTSPYSYTNASVFTAEEISDVIKTFELLAPEQTPFTESNQQLSKFKRGYTLKAYNEEEGTVMANAVVHLFDSWSKEDSDTRQYILYHEFAHNMSRNYFSATHTSSAWLKLSEWKKVLEGDGKDKAIAEFRSSLASKMGHPFVSKYGKANPGEDFAESVTAYRLNPQHLKKTSPEKYKILKHVVFNNQEFLSQKNCNQQTATKQYQKEIESSKNLFLESEKDTISNACRLTFDQTILGNVPVSYFDDCVNFQATLLWYNKNHQTYKGLLQQGLFDNDLRLSNLKFTETRNELAQRMAIDLAHWISEKMKVYSYKMADAKTNDEYCELWTNLANGSYDKMDFDSEWRTRSFARNVDISPLKGAARGLCLDLVHEIPPEKKTTFEYYKKQIKKFLFIGGVEAQEESAVKDRGLNEENIKKYILDKVGT